jgi:hypothetical protein
LATRLRIYKYLPGFLEAVAEEAKALTPIGEAAGKEESIFGITAEDVLS